MIGKMTNRELLHYCYLLFKTSEAPFGPCEVACQELLKRTDDLKIEIKDPAQIRSAYGSVLFACFRASRTMEDSVHGQIMTSIFLENAAKKGYKFCGRIPASLPKLYSEFRKFNCEILLDMRRRKRLKKPIGDHQNVALLDYYFNGGA